MAQFLCLRTPLALLAVIGSLTACGSPETVNINRSYTMIDEQERVAGMVTFYAVGGGEVRDASGKKIGDITAP